ncbi:phosphotransferase [Microbacterium sp.]|uniref:phosphotransferase n=1 Tax=Microbacterium sp. TaxID=51671 RepID=UPI002810CA12|nr:phosphotransferase [Microbacterium sp.]
MADSPPAELRLHEHEVRALLRAQAPHLADLSLTPIAEEWDNVTWRLGDDLAVRMPRRAAAAHLIHHEQFALPLLAPALADAGIRTPVPLVHGRAGATFPWPWSIVPWLPGTPALARTRAENAGWAEKLARALHALHRPAPSDAPSNPVRGVALGRRDEGIRERLRRHPEHPVLTEAWEAGLRAPLNAEPVWIHGDLHPGNMLVDGTDLTAIIDFGDVTAGDPAYDLATGWMLFEPEGRERFRRAAGDRYDDGDWTRARAWAAALAVILIGASDDRPALRRLGLETAAQLADG